MQNRMPFITLTLLILLGAGCSSTSTSVHQPSSATSAAQTPWLDADSMKALLYQQHQHWQGTRYQLGGLSQQGVDCSGLVYLTYLNRLGKAIPRTTEYQSQTGKAVKRSELRAGDLVFFKTSKKVRHVGIYIEDEKFLHASTKKGVMVSKLSDYYWKDRYWHARRVNF